jgi:ABC-type antimicrobial peptide transport system permease subunit
VTSFPVWGRRPGRLLESSLFGIAGSDAITYAGSAGTFLLVAFFACLLPARRAAAADPVTALRWQ